jgi:hypothetical protein
MITHENFCLRPGGTESRLNGQSLVKKWRITDPKMIFAKKSGGWLFSAKVQNHPGSTKIGKELAQILKYTSEGCRNETRPHIRIPGGLVFLWGVFPSFWFRVSMAASQKTRFRHSENGKSTFHRTKRKSASVAFLAIPRTTRVSDIASFRQTMSWSW